MGDVKEKVYWVSAGQGPWDIHTSLFALSTLFGNSLPLSSQLDFIIIDIDIIITTTTTLNQSIPPSSPSIWQTV
jgi:hypothetical protein